MTGNHFVEAPGHKQGNINRNKRQEEREIAHACSGDSAQDPPFVGSDHLCYGEHFRARVP